MAVKCSLTLLLCRPPHKAPRDANVAPRLSAPTFGAADWRVFGAFCVLPVSCALGVLPAPVYAQSIAAPAYADALQEWQAVYPQITINGRTSDVLLKLWSYNGVLYANAQSLAALGIAPSEVAADLASPADGGNIAPDAASHAAAHAAPAGVRWADAHATLPPKLQGEGRLFELASWPRLQVAYNAARQTLDLQAPLEWLNLPVTNVGPSQNTPLSATAPGFGLVLNYDAYASGDSQNNRSAWLLAELRAVTPWGFFNHTHLGRNQSSASLHAGASRSSSHTQRLDSYWRSSWPQAGISLTLGDTVSSTLNGGGGTRIGGFRLESNFALQPQRLTTPLLQYTGSATLPSTLDLYLNGVQQYSHQVPAGPYALTLPPGISGAGVARVVATDMLGRTTVTDLPLYGGTQLLAKGLSDWSIAAGYIRKQYGIENFSYGKQPAASASLRHGISNYFTAQVQGEATRGYNQFGTAGNLVLGALGQLNASYARSQYQGVHGSRYSLSFSSQIGKLYLSAGHSQTQGHMASLGSTLYPQEWRKNQSEDARSRVSSASLGVGDATWGNWSASYVRSQSSRSKPFESTATINWSRNLGRAASIYAGLSKNMGKSGHTTASIGLSISLDNGYSASTSVQHQPDSTQWQASLNRSAQGLDSVGWSIGMQQQHQRNNSGSTQRHQSAQGSLQYSNQYGDATAAIYGQSGTNNWNAGWRGGLVWMDGGLFASKSINDSFAIVSTEGVPDIPVLLHNRPIGNTNRHGLLLAPNLSAYQNNPIHIDTLNLPGNMAIERTQAQAVPSEKAGVSVRFGVKKVRAALLTLKNADGSHPPAGSQVHNAQGQAVAVVGFDGQTYLSDLPAGAQHFTVHLPESSARCNFTLPDIAVPDTATTVPKFEAIPCEKHP